MWKNNALRRIAVSMLEVTRFLIALFVGAIAFSGCGRLLDSSEPTRYLLPWNSGSGRYSAQEIEITSLSSKTEVRGEAAVVYFENRLTPQGFEGSPAQAQVTQSDKVLVPTDAASSMALSVYAVYERLRAFDQQLGAWNQVRWPRSVGVNQRILGSGGLQENNAHYLGSSDITVFLPYSMDGVPFVVNHGVVAHEHFHAHFQSQVLNRLEASGSANEFERVNRFMLRAWNEGLADLYAAIYTGDSSFFLASAPNWSIIRGLEAGGLERLSVGASFATQLRNSQAKGYSEQDQNSEMEGEAYAEGTRLARLLFRISRSSGVGTQQKFLGHLMTRLNRVAPLVAQSLRSQWLDSDSILPVLLDEIDLDASACRSLSTTVRNETFKNGFARCLGR